MVKEVDVSALQQPFEEFNVEKDVTPKTNVEIVMSSWTHFGRRHENFGDRNTILEFILIQQSTESVVACEISTFGGAVANSSGPFDYPLKMRDCEFAVLN